MNGLVGVSKITDEAERICASKIALIGLVERLVVPLHGVEHTVKQCEAVAAQWQRPVSSVRPWAAHALPVGSCVARVCITSRHVATLVADQIEERRR
jgi:hypothetical protein